MHHDERDPATQIRDEDVRQAFPVLEPFVSFPSCKMCGSKHIMLASLLERKGFIRKSQRLGAFVTIYCPGNQQRPAPCQGIGEPHQHIACISCQYGWLTVTYPYQEKKRHFIKPQPGLIVGLWLVTAIVIFVSMIVGSWLLR